jgi:hypothetical protein
MWAVGIGASFAAPAVHVIRIADEYFSNLQGSTGRSSAPFAPSCERWENGTQTTHVAPAHPARATTVAAPVDAPLTLQISELCQIGRGKIDQIEAAITTVPYGRRSDVWDRS